MGKVNIRLFRLQFEEQLYKKSDDVFKKIKPIIEKEFKKKKDALNLWVIRLQKKQKIRAEKR